jgi:hypothetical protein
MRTSSISAGEVTAIAWKTARVSGDAGCQQDCYRFTRYQHMLNAIDEALAEIRAIARRGPAAAGEGAVILLEKLPLALCEVDSCASALGNATWSAVKTLVPMIADAPVNVAFRGFAPLPENLESPTFSGCVPGVL